MSKGRCMKGPWLYLAIGSGDLSSLPVVVQFDEYKRKMTFNQREIGQLLFFDISDHIEMEKCAQYWPTSKGNNHIIMD